ncbi:MAG: hypothetical protein K6L76_00490 [Agarilytica sp.]
MGHRSIVLLVGALCAFAASHVSALGLGKITLDSSLNQPLKAKIELLEVQELTKDEIKIQVAEREDFDRIGIEKTYFLSDLKFDVVLEGTGAPYVSVSSRKLVREPFLNFIVQLRWPSGKVLREYTLLLDLPVFAGKQAPSVQASQQSPSQQAPSQQPQTYQPSPADTGYNPRSEYEAAPSRPQQREVAPTYTGDSYQVRTSDTLWEIAASVRPDGGVSIHQTMLAIQRENPQAFINNNINLLKAGQILRIPDRDDMVDLEQRSAVREVAQQNSAWSDSDDVSDATLSASNSYTSSSEGSSSPEGRLKLASPDDAYDSSEGRSSGSTADSSTDALENELSATLEQLDSSSRENKDLRSKVSSLEEQIETMERMLEVSNESMRALELAAKQREEAAANNEGAVEDSVETSDPVAEEESEFVSEDTDYEATENSQEGMGEELAIGEVDVDTEIDTESLSDALQEGLSDEDADAEGSFDDEAAEEVVEEVVEATPAPEVSKPVVIPPPAQKSIVDLILENILYVVGGVVVLVGVIFVVFRKKGGDDADDFFEEHGLNDLSSAEEHDDSTVIQDRDRGEEEDLGLGDLDEAQEEVPSLTEFEEDVAEDDGDGEAQTEDVVTEADIYIAYGRFDRAEEMLLNALAKDANDEDVRLKLLEVYSTQGDAENFDPHYAKLRAFASDATIERADALRASIPHIAEFDESSFDTADVDAGASDAATEDDFGLGLDLDAPAEEGASDEVSLDLDDDLSLDTGGEDLASDGLGEFDLGDDSSNEEQGFDLDLGDLDSDGDPDASLEIELPDESEIVDATDAGSDLADGLDLDFDIEDAADSDTDDLGELDLDLGESSGDSDLEDLEAGLGDLDGDLSLDSDISFDIEGDDLDADLSLDLDKGAESTESDDSALSIDLDSESELDTDFGDLNASASLEESAEGLESFDADLGDDLELGDLDLDVGSEDSVGSDTVVNEALNDEYIEQKLSEDSDLDMNLEGDIPLETEEPQLSEEFEAMSKPAPAPVEEASAAVEESDDLSMSDDDDLDLSSLDQELDELTAGVDGESDEIPTMEEPLTDLDAFDDDLERDEAAAEVVSTGATPEKPVEEMGEDTMFQQALNETPAVESGFEIPEVSAEDVDDDDLDFLSDSDETATKLDLARAYIDMGDQEGARDIIREILEEGNDEQKEEAQGLLSRIES